MSRWFLYVYGGLTLVTEEEDMDGWRCVAAGTEDACEAAARLWA